MLTLRLTTPYALCPTIRPPLCAAAQVAYAANDDVLVSGGYDQCIKVWDTKSRSFDPIQTMKHFKVCECVCVCGGGG